MIKTLNDDNFLLFAAKHYDNPQCFDTEEFYDDLNRFKYLKRLFNKYEESGDLKERLILNHLIILYNVFGSATTTMLFYKLDGYYPYLKPFIMLLGYMPETISNVGTEGSLIYSSDISMDQHIVDVLRKI
jgi:hypothetical protein